MTALISDVAGKYSDATGAMEQNAHILKKKSLMQQHMLQT